MFDWIRQRVLWLMRVPPAPEPPAGAPESVRVFRAGRNYYRLRVARWLVAQLGAVVGICFSLGFLAWFRLEVERSRALPPPPPAATSVVTPAPAPTDAKLRRQRPPIRRADLQRLAQRTPDWALILIELFEAGGILLFFAQLPVTFAAVRLEYEMHWYIVTDRSLRIRTGLMRLQESTMSFANLQQVEVQQGPLQRLLGLADLRVQSAGGGSTHPEKPGEDSLHTGIFHSVVNAPEIRDLILERLRTFRQAGLGDPDDHHHAPAPAAAPVTPGDTLAAAQELLAEARALRATLAS
ncbi:MAG: PH domain-containing protein [Verrucomicrobia bacterium]|nr:PH domain-containing protein [Verrucomicrobiota bacterium]